MGFLENHMGRFGTAAFLILVGAVTTLAADLPTRKAGLWKIYPEWTRDRPGLEVQQCIDALTDRMMMMQTYVGAHATACPKGDVQRSNNTITIDSACTTHNGQTVTTQTVITGSFDSAYTMTVAGTVTGESDALPEGKVTGREAAEWLGPCAADQKPGDAFMGGVKWNALEELKRRPSRGVPPPP